MSGSGEEPKSEGQDRVIEIDEQVSRSDFLKKLIAGGVVSVAAISGLGGLQKVLGQTNTGASSAISGNGTTIDDLIQKVNQLTKQLGDITSGKVTVPELVVDKLTVPATETSYVKIAADSTFYKIQVPATDGGYVKMAADSTFYKIQVPENGFLKCDGNSAFLKLDVPATEGGYMKIDAQSTFLKLEVPETGKMRIDASDVAFIKIQARDIVANKIEAQTISFEQPQDTRSD
jgi:hypothetical protein